MPRYFYFRRAVAQARVRFLTRGWRTFWGSGNPYYQPYAMVTAYPDHYAVWLRPQGDHSLGELTLVWFERC